LQAAFVKEDVDSAAERLPDRAIPPHPNLVTAEGLALIGDIIANLKAEHAAAQAADDAQALAPITRDLRYWNARQATAQLTEPTTRFSSVQGSPYAASMEANRVTESSASTKPILHRERFLIYRRWRRLFSAGRSATRSRLAATAPRSST
jgi:hypothetical protein